MSFSTDTGEFISLQDAKELRETYKNQGDQTHTQANAYGITKILGLLSQNGAVGLRMYHGLKDVGGTYQRELVIVAVDSNGDDILDPTAPKILDLSNPCPNYCDHKNSPLL
jgi:hypothetical protein